MGNYNHSPPSTNQSSEVGQSFLCTIDIESLQSNHCLFPLSALPHLLNEHRGNPVEAASHLMDVWGLDPGGQLSGLWMTKVLQIYPTQYVDPVITKSCGTTFNILSPSPLTPISPLLTQIGAPGESWGQRRVSDHHINFTATLQCTTISEATRIERVIYRHQAYDKNTSHFGERDLWCTQWNSNPQTLYHRLALGHDHLQHMKPCPVGAILLLR